MPGLSNDKSGKQSLPHDICRAGMLELKVEKADIGDLETQDSTSNIVLTSLEGCKEAGRRVTA